MYFTRVLVVLIMVVTIGENQPTADWQCDEMESPCVNARLDSLMLIIHQLTDDQNKASEEIHQLTDDQNKASEEIGLMKAEILNLKTQLNSTQKIIGDMLACKFSGKAFGAGTVSNNSYQIFSLNNWPSTEIYNSNMKYIRSYTIIMRFKTYEANGILFYAENTNSSHITHVTDMIGAYIKDGYVHHIIDNYAGPGIAKTTAQYNDGSWHTAKFVKNSDSCQVCVDDEDCQSGKAAASGGIANVVDAFKVGGVPSNLVSKAKHTLTLSTGFKGCITNITFNGGPDCSPIEEYQITECCVSYPG